MTSQSPSQLPKPQTDAPVPSGDAGITKAQPVATAPALTFSRGTRPLSTRRPATGSQHDYRRRSA